MILHESKENSIRKEFFHTIRLSGKNRELAEKYLDMDRPEDPGLLETAEHQDLASSIHWMEAKADYVKWLLKRNRTEELARLARLLVKVGGSTASRPLVSYEYFARPAALEKRLACLKGPGAGAQKTALRAGLCVQSLLTGNPEAVKEVCRLGKKNPEIFLDALPYCYGSGRAAGFGQGPGSFMLLQAMYLYYMEEGAAPERVCDLEERLIASMEEVMAFERRELACIQEFARTADRDTPFPQRILSIYSQRRSGTNTPAHFWHFGIPCVLRSSCG